MLKSFFIDTRRLVTEKENDNLAAIKRKRAPLRPLEGKFIKSNIVIPKNPDFLDKNEDEDFDDDTLQYELTDTNDNKLSNDEKFVFTHQEIPIGDPSNCQDVFQYEQIIYRQMRERELIYPDNVVIQDLTAYERGTTIDYIDRIHYKSQLTTNSLYTAFGIFDRLLKLTIITGESAKAFGVASLLLASKMEDIRPLKIDIAVACSHNTLSAKDLLKKEMQISYLLDFDFAFPTPLFFLNYFIRLSNVTQEKLLFARYVMETCLTSQDFAEIKPSAIAATAIVFMRMIYQPDDEPWTEELANFSQYGLDDLEQHILDAYQLLITEREESCFIRTKYETDEFHNVALKEIPDVSILF